MQYDWLKHKFAILPRYFKKKVLFLVPYFFLNTMSDKEQDRQESNSEEKMEDSEEESSVKEEDAPNSTKDISDDEKQEAKDSKSEESKPDVKSKDKKKEEVEVDDEEEEDEVEDEPKVGLLEQPVVLEEGRKRERKKVERMSFQSPEAEKEKVEIKPGKGTALGEIPWIEHRMSRVKAEDIKPLHRILFRRVGTALEVKKNIRKFSGFPFSKSDPEFEKRMQILKAKTFTKPMIAHVCEILDVPRSGNKEEVSDRLMEWLMKPEDSGKKVPNKRKAKSKERVKKGAKGKGKQKKSKSKAKDDDDEDDDDEDNEEVAKSEAESEDDSDDESESDKDSDEEPPPKKKMKITKDNKKPTKAKKEPAKKTETKKKAAPKKKVSDDEVSDISSDSDDEKPIAKSKPKGPPTNDELKEVIKKMLDSANLEEVTMKSVLKEIFAKYPDHDLSDRKEFVKGTVKQLIS